MHIAAILRSLADIIEKSETITPHNGMKQVEIDDNSTSTTDDTGMFISPLQQEIELMKKNAGVDNVFNDQEEKTDEIEQLKIMSGIK